MNPRGTGRLGKLGIFLFFQKENGAMLGRKRWPVKAHKRPEKKDNYQFIALQSSSDYRVEPLLLKIYC